MINRSFNQSISHKVISITSRHLHSNNICLSMQYIFIHPNNVNKVSYIIDTINFNQDSNHCCILYISNCSYTRDMELHKLNMCGHRYNSQMSMINNPILSLQYMFSKRYDMMCKIYCSKGRCL